MLKLINMWVDLTVRTKVALIFFLCVFGVFILFLVWPIETKHFPHINTMKGRKQCVKVSCSVCCCRCAQTSNKYLHSNELERYSTTNRTIRAITESTNLWSLIFCHHLTWFTCVVFKAYVLFNTEEIVGSLMSYTQACCSSLVLSDFNERELFLPK